MRARVRKQLRSKSQNTKAERLRTFDLSPMPVSALNQREASRYSSTEPLEIVDALPATALYLPATTSETGIVDEKQLHECERGLYASSMMFSGWRRFLLFASCRGQQTDGARTEGLTEE
jgi:hypothetical protein